MTLLGETFRESGVVADRDETTDGTVPGGGEAVVASLDEPGARQLAGQVVANGGYNVRIDWLAEDGETVVRAETVASGVGGGTWTDLDEPVKSPRVEIIVEDAGTLSGDLTASATVKMTK